MSECIENPVRFLPDGEIVVRLKIEEFSNYDVFFANSRAIWKS